jgi:hypothetical protein
MSKRGTIGLGVFAGIRARMRWLRRFGGPVVKFKATYKDKHGNIIKRDPLCYLHAYAKCTAILKAAFEAAGGNARWAGT